MIMMYTQSGCRSCMTSRRWFNKHGIKFQEKNFSKHPPKLEELRKILALSDSGLDDIVSSRSQAYSKFGPELLDLPLNTALQILCDYPKLLRRPIIVSNTKLQIGFNEDEIRKFIPRSIRRLECDDLLKQLEPPQI